MTYIEKITLLHEKKKEIQLKKKHIGRTGLFHRPFSDMNTHFLIVQYHAPRGFKPTTFLLESNSANHCTTVQICTVFMK